MTVYTFVIEGQDLEQIATSDVEPTFRPRVGSEIKISTRPETLWRITRSIPSNNPDNVSVTYVVEDLRDIAIVREGGVGDFNQSYVTNSKFGNEMYRFARNHKY